MPGFVENRTYWTETAETTSFPELAGDVKVDVAIVGGGIVGITAARLLKDAGLTAQF
jgi:ribulose 1,5-bisphosphate synthetase/thiazole synthase